MASHPRSDPGGSHEISQEEILRNENRSDDEIIRANLAQIPAYRKRRDDDDDLYYGPLKIQSSKQKTKPKKPPREAPFALNFEFAGKPTGASSSSHFAGDDDSDSSVFEQAAAMGSRYAESNLGKLTGQHRYLPQYETCGGDVGQIAYETTHAVHESDVSKDDQQYMSPLENHDVAEPEYQLLAQPGLDHGDQTVDQYASLPQHENQYLAWSTDDGTAGAVRPEIRDGIGALSSFEFQENENNYDTKEEESGEESYEEQGQTSEDDSPIGKTYEDDTQRLKEELLNVKKASDSMKKAMQLQIDQLTSDKKELEEALKKASSSHQSEQQKSQHEKNKLKEELNKRNSSVEKLQSDLDDKTGLCEQLQEKFKQLLMEREKLLRMLVEASKKCNCNIDLNIMKQRACAAEAALVKLKKQVELRDLGRAVRDAEFIISHLTGVMQKVRKDDIAALLEYQEKWKANLEAVKMNSALVEKAFDDQIAQIERGIPLATLPAIKVPPVPVAPQPPTKPGVNPDLFKPAPPNNSISRISVVSSPASSGASNDVRQVSPIGQMPSEFSSGSGQRQSFQIGNGNPGFRMPSSMPSQFMASTSFAHTPEQIPAQNMVPPGFAPTANMDLPMYRPVLQMNQEGAQERNRLVELLKGPPEPRVFDEHVRPINTSPFRPISPAGPIQNVVGAMGLGSAVPLATNTNVTQTQAEAATAEKAPSKLEKLINEVLVRMPHLSKDNVMNCVTQYRKLQAGESLRGIKFTVLVDGVCEFGRKMYPPPARPPPVQQPSYALQQAVQPSQQPFARPLGFPVSMNPTVGFPMPAASYASGLPTNPMVQQLQQQQHRQLSSKGVDDECFVCLEKLSVKKIMVMDCKHVAHEECLHKWLAQHKTCPMCRSLHLRHDEYPALGQ